MSTQPFAFPIPFMKRSGGGPMTADVQHNIFATDAMPENPDNKQYLPVINASGYPSVRVRSKRMPRWGVHTCLKPKEDSTHGWSDADFFISHLSTDTNNLTDDFAYGFQDGVDERIYDRGRCERVDFAQRAEGGPCAVFLGYKGRWGDHDAPYGTTLSSGEVIGSAPSFNYTGEDPDAGEATPASLIEVTGVTQVMGFQITLLRGQGVRYYFNGDNGPAHIASTMFSGVVTLDQESDADTFIDDDGTVVFKFNTDLTSSTGRFKLTCILSRDNFYKPQTTTLGVTTTTFSCFAVASGGNPSLFQGY